VWQHNSEPQHCHWCSPDSPTELLGLELFLGCREWQPVDARWGRECIGGSEYLTGVAQQIQAILRLGGRAQGVYIKGIGVAEVCVEPQADQRRCR
jgi:hypothetical protein